MQIDSHAEALKAYADLVKKYPRGGVWGEYARAAAISGDFDLADQLWGKIRAMEPNTADLLMRLAWEYQNVRLHAKARELYRQAAGLEPNNLDAQLKLAWLLARTNSIDDAREAVGKCLKLDSSNEHAHYLAAHLDRRENKLSGAEQQFRDLIASGPRDPYVRYSCHSELAHILDRTERYDEAMAQLSEGKNFARQKVNQEAERKRIDVWHDDLASKTKSLPANILDTWGKAFPPSARKPSVSLTFLTGSARSGTTLLERILDAHPALTATDECLAFTKTLPLVDITAPVIPGQRLNLFRQRYMNISAKVAGPIGPGKMLLDKNPSRTIWLAAFLRVFPELRVLIALRDPRDIMVSLYFQNQTSTNYLTWELLAQHYKKVMDVWLTVREWQGLVWLETRYEDIVADLQKEGSRVTDFLGLRWHENQTRFYQRNQEKPVMSTNYNAVSQPLYTRAVGRWKIYEKHLAPVLPMLDFYCKIFGYA